MMVHGIDARQRGEVDQAIGIFEEAVLALAGMPAPSWNLGEALMAQGRYDEAREWLWRSARIDPSNTHAWRNLGVCEWKQGNAAAAIPHLQQALRCDPHNREARHDLGVIALAEGDYDLGWSEYIWRLVVQRKAFPIAPLPKPYEKRVVIVPEQGLGDLLFFARWLPFLRERGVTEMHCAYPRKVAGILARALPDVVEGYGDDDCVDLRMGDLPFLTGVPGPLAPLSLVPSGRDNFSFANFPRPIIGVTWRAGTTSNLGQWKETPASDFAELVKALGGTAVLLQRKATMEDRAAFDGVPVIDLCHECDEPEFVLDLLPHLDAYVTVSNTNVHLAAGLPEAQRPEMHVLVTHPPEPRWMTRGDSSPWFPGMTCYRQDGMGRWPVDTFRRIGKALRR